MHSSTHIRINPFTKIMQNEANFNDRSQNTVAGSQEKKIENEANPPAFGLKLEVLNPKC
ncbi:MAG: hypothetical protein JW715_08710 [Sedimentisphaerales bacterium]|nr:hypothetical protein [Sedimentisphaerales bacterium]